MSATAPFAKVAEVAVTAAAGVTERLENAMLDAASFGNGCERRRVRSQKKIR